MNYSTQFITRNICIFTSAAALSFTQAARGDHHNQGENTSGAATQTQTETTKTTTSDLDKEAAQFLREAFHGNQMEVVVAKLGIARAQNSELKAYAEELKRDHSEANAKLAQIAQKHGVVLHDPDITSEKAKEQLGKLEKLSGIEFDKQFALTALKDHQKDIAKYQKAARKVKAADVKRYVKETLPTLKQHQTEAAELARSFGVDQSTITQFTKEQPEAVGGGSETGEGADDQSEALDNDTPRSARGHGADTLKQEQPDTSR